MKILLMFSIIYSVFVWILIILNLIYKKYLKGNIKYLYLIYWHILFIIIIWSWLYYWYKLEKVWYLNISNKDNYIFIFLTIIFPWMIFYIKNQILNRYFNINLNVTTYTLLDFIKMFLMFVTILLLTALIGYLI